MQWLDPAESCSAGNILRARQEQLCSNTPHGTFISMETVYVQASALLSVQFYEVDLPPVSEKKIKLVNAVIPDEKRVSICDSSTA